MTMSLSAIRTARRLLFSIGTKGSFRIQSVAQRGNDRCVCGLA